MHVEAAVAQRATKALVRCPQDVLTCLVHVPLRQPKVDQRKGVRLGVEHYIFRFEVAVQNEFEVNSFEDLQHLEADHEDGLVSSRYLGVEATARDAVDRADGNAAVVHHAVRVVALRPVRQDLRNCGHIF